jgi:hypothetical protein
MMMGSWYIRILKINLICWIILFGSSSSAQTRQDNADNYFTGSYSENLNVRTDRDIYISGEQIWLKIYKLSGLTGCPDNLSKIVYVELLDTQFNPLNQIKVMVDGTSGSAFLMLSDTLSSGNYLIRAYTKWMLNSTADRDVYKPIFIINPFKKIYNLLSSSIGPNPGNGNDPLSGSSISVTGQAKKDPDNQISIKINPLQGQYGQRERVQIDINVSDRSGKPVDADMLVSVVRSPLVFSGGMNDFPGFLSDTLTGTIRQSQGRWPEIEGEFVTGTIRYISSGEPVQNEEISLSFVGKKDRCRFSRTNYNGEFLFVVKDQFGPGEIVIQPLSKNIRDVYVELDQPFSTVFDEYTFQFPVIDSSRVEGINKAIIATQVGSVYDQIGKKNDLPAENLRIATFYSTPSRRVKMSDFIELTDIREVVKELLPEVAVYRKNKDVGLKVIPNNPYVIFDNQAIVLVDGVPVHDVEALLKVPSKEFDHIDIIDAKYYYKDFIFEGIVSFVTNKGNGNVMEPDNSAYRQLFDGAQQKAGFYEPDYRTDSLKASLIPDFRNTLLWEPEIRSGSEGRTHVQFYTSDEGGTYTIIIEGITSDGKRGICMMPLNVR